MRAWILATGGAGYVGSHVVAELLAAGHAVTILDNFENARRDTPRRIAEIGHGVPEVEECDVRDGPGLDRVFARRRYSAVIHLAGLKAVGDSVVDPLRYYDANLSGAVTLLRAMIRARQRRFVFSSSATVYGAPRRVPVDEQAPLRPTNPYGRTKRMIERIATDVVAAHPDFAAVSLRYFNPVGAHPSGLIGEYPKGPPNNLFPFIAQTAAGRRAIVQVFGADYDTPDGTGVRDYIHVVDLARGHVAALSYLLGGGARGRHRRVNLGKGDGHSVMEALGAFSRACGFEIPYEIVARRPGDVAECVADPRRAERLFGWRAERDLETMARDHWAFQQAAADRDRRAQKLPA
jgi:UDP-glucose 4-epimerase